MNKHLEHIGKGFEIAAYGIFYLSIFYIAKLLLITVALFWGFLAKDYPESTHLISLVMDLFIFAIIMIIVFVVIRYLKNHWND